MYNRFINRNLIYTILILLIICCIYSNQENFYDLSKINNKLLNLPKLIYNVKSPFQHIQLYKIDNFKNDNYRNNIDYFLLLNNVVQFHTKEYQNSHNIQGLYPMMKYKPKNVLILGGGDGFFANIASKVKSIEKITLVEIDKEMINMVKNNLVMKQLTDNVFNNDNVEIIIDDAIEWIFKVNNHYDLIIEDVEINFTKQSDNLESKTDKRYINILKQYFKIADTISISMEIYDKGFLNQEPDYNGETDIATKIWNDNKGNFVKISNTDTLKQLINELLYNRVQVGIKEKEDMKKISEEIEEIYHFLKDKEVYFAAYDDEHNNENNLSDLAINKEGKLPTLGFEGYLLISKKKHDCLH